MRRSDLEAVAVGFTGAGGRTAGDVANLTGQDDDDVSKCHVVAGTMALFGAGRMALFGEALCAYVARGDLVSADGLGTRAASAAGCGRGFVRGRTGRWGGVVLARHALDRFRRKRYRFLAGVGSSRWASPSVRERIPRRVSASRRRRGGSVDRTDGRTDIYFNIQEFHYKDCYLIQIQFNSRTANER